MKGLYTVMAKLVERFPSVLFEGCSGGGSRFDLGVLCFMPQIWTSDNTDARCRTKIQTGTSYGYPQSAISCHVSASPNHQTGKDSAFETRFNVAALGAFGYELDITALSDDEKRMIKKQITFFKKYRKVLQFGEFYRLGDVFNSHIGGHICVQQNKALAVASVWLDSRWGYKVDFVRFKGLEPKFVYEVTTRTQDNYLGDCVFTATGELLEYAGIPIYGLLTDNLKESKTNGLYTRTFVIKKVEKKAKAEK
jgi:alpha-galactosidase